MRELQRKLILVLFSVLFTIIMLEIGLAVIGAPVGYSHAYYEARQQARINDERICDMEVGCRYNPIYAGRCDITRYGCINSEGYIAPEPQPDSRFTVMALGDSFAEGFTATAGHGMWAVVQADMPQVAVHNYAIYGTGTQQAVTTARLYGHVVEPDAIVVSFFVGNDYYDNYLPLDNLMSIHLPPDENTNVESVSIASYGEDTRYTDAADLYTLYLGLPVCDNFVCEALMKTRVGTLALTIDYRRRTTVGDAQWDEEVANTISYFTQLKHYTDENHIQLAVLVIPSYANASEGYYTIIDILNQLQILIIDTLPHLTLEDYNGKEDVHWNDSGHRIAADLIEAYLGLMLAK